MREIVLIRKNFRHLKSSSSKNFSFSAFTQILSREFSYDTLEFEKNFRMRLNIFNLHKLLILIFKRKLLNFLKFKKSQLLFKITKIQTIFKSYKLRKNFKLIKTSANKIKKFYLQYINKKKSKYSIIIQCAIRGL